jgi:selenocysteine-specific elongation factor
MLEARGLTPPTTQEMADELRIKERSLRDILEKLVYAGKVVKVKSDMYLAARHMEELKSLVKEELTKRKEMLPADFKAMTGLSRKYMIPLLEYLDEIKLTIRSGDKRVLRSG